MHGMNADKQKIILGSWLFFLCLDVIKGLSAWICVHLWLNRFEVCPLWLNASK